MVRTCIRKCPYTILLAVSIFLAAGAWKTGYIRTEDRKIIVKLPGLEEFYPELQKEEEILDGNRPQIQAWASREVLRQETKEKETEVKEIEEVLNPVRYEADASWFDDALFIGDSRTVGLHEYGNLGNAEVVADSGMSVYKLFGKEFTFSSGEKGTLEELLSGKKFGKIYLMLGINELGYDFERTVSRYQETVEKIHELQPDALLFLQANLHITKDKSESSAIYNNANIDRFNEAVKALADHKTRFYLDVNELFDDEEGNLSAEYTADQAHVLGKYYADWVKWILQHAVTFEPAAQDMSTDRTDMFPQS